MAKRIFLFLCLLSAALAAGRPALAQVAAPTLTPGFVTDNPAAIQWGSRSQAGVLGFQIEVDETDTTTVPAITVTDIDLDGYLAGFRLVGEQVSLAAEFARGTGTFNTFDAELESGNGALAFQLLGLLAIGGGVFSETSEISGDSPIGPVAQEETSDINRAGVSLRIGELLYLGAAVGKETFEEVVTVPLFPAFNSQSTIERDVAAYGVALLDREGVQWHLELAVQTADFAQDELTGRVLDEEEEQSVVLEVNFGGLLVGIGGATSESTDRSVTPSTTVEETGRAVTLGWVPEQGLSAVLSYQTAESDPAPGVTSETNTAFLLLSYRF